MEPFNLGGHMIRKVQFEETTWGDLPHKFEAGTSPIAEAVGFGAAVDYLNEVGLEAIEQYEHDLVSYALERLADVPGIRLYGPPPERRAGIVSFNMEGIHPHDVAQVQDGRARNPRGPPLLPAADGPLGVAGRTAQVSTSTRCGGDRPPRRRLLRARTVRLASLSWTTCIAR